MKKFRLLNLIFNLSLGVMPVFAGPAERACSDQVYGIHCAPQLQKYLGAISNLKEGKQLIDEIMQNGPISIIAADNTVTEKFAACWDYEHRIILIGLACCPSEGDIISSILFELHNAAMSPRLDHLDQMALQRKIGKQKYIRSVEHVEYTNSVNASKIASIGVQQGLFPKNTRLRVYASFEEYFYYQRMSGHSDIIGRNYDILMQSASS